MSTTFYDNPIGVAPIPKARTKAAAILREVWPPRIRGYANLELRHDPLQVIAWRCQGDVYHWVSEGVIEYPTDERQQIREFDRAVQNALARIPLMTVADALLAGESRRCPR